MPESKLSTTSPDTEPSFSALSDITNAPADAQIKHSDSIAYWDSIESTDNGMLGGYPHVSRVDIMGSRAFLVKCGISGAVKREQRAGGSAAKRDAGGEKKENVKEGGEKAEVKEEKRLKRVVDCGAGIGRISKGLLIPLASTVDIVEPIKKFTDQLAGVAGIGQIYNSGLESWSPEEGTKYNLIWNQWCLGHLTDAQLIAYLKKCGGLLARSEDGKVTGLCVVKENLTVFDDMFDETDSSVTRTEEKFKALFKEAGMKILRTEIQKGFPKELYAVRMWALKPEISPAPAAKKPESSSYNNSNENR